MVNGKDGNICLVTINIDYKEITYNDKICYSKKNKYEFVIYNHTLDSTRHNNWSKFIAIQKTFKKKKCNYIFWVDIDTIIMNHEIKMESVIDFNYDLIISGNYEAIFNNGVFVLKRSNWTLKYLKLLYNQMDYLKNKWADQDAMVRMHEKNLINAQNHTKIIPQETFNLFPHMYKNGNYLVHFCGLSYGKKVELYNKFYFILKQDYLNNNCLHS